MAATPAIAALEGAEVVHEVHSYHHDPRTEDYGGEAVEAMTAATGVRAEQIFKTLVVEVSPSGGGRPFLAVAVIPVPRRMAPKAVAAALGGGKVAMADKGKVTRSSGYVLGGVSPIGQRTALPTVVDNSALDFDVVLCSAGKRGLEVALAPADLIAITDAVTAPIAI